MKTTRIFSLLFFVILSLTACEKEDDDMGGNQTVTGKLLIKEQIIYDSNGISENSHTYYTYDKQGRLTGINKYLHGKLEEEYKDYVYSGRELNYVKFSYDEFEALRNKEKHRELYDDNGNMVEWSMSRNDQNDKMFHAYFFYDIHGRKIGSKTLYYNDLSFETKDYEYVNDTLTYYSYYSPSISDKNVNIFNSDKKIVEEIVYSLYFDTESSHKYIYFDEQGRDVGYKLYEFGRLVSEAKDYIYSGKELIYTQYEFINNWSIETEVKCKTIFY